MIIQQLIDKMVNKKTQLVVVEIETKKKLDKLRLVPNETYTNVIKRLVEKELKKDGASKL